MKEYTTEKIRNIAMVSHSGAGKTTLAEALLAAKDVINRMGSVSDGTTVSDFDEEEHRRELSLSTSVIPIEHKDFKINLLRLRSRLIFVHHNSYIVCLINPFLINSSGSASVD